jgi:SAM-dependent methyltransferase
VTTSAPEHAGLDCILEHIDPASMRGLEIGPLHNPVIAKEQGVLIAYVDHADTEALRKKYADDPNVPFVHDVDFVWGDHRLADAIGEAGAFDYVIASHVMEHVPDLVAWLGELAEVLRPGGVVSLVIPDKRFCFDTRRPPTDVSEIIEASLEKRRRPSLAQIFDFESRYVEVDTLAMWAGRPGYGDEPVRTLAAYEKCVDAMDHDDYVDVHATTWTPSSFAEALRTLFQLDLVAFRVASFHATPFNSLEFYVTLERLSDDVPVEERRRMQLDSIPELHEDRPLSAVHDPVPTAEGRVLLDVSRREAKLLETKRRLFGVARAGVRRALRAVRPPPPTG